jgi:hypothetical protein
MNNSAERKILIKIQKEGFSVFSVYDFLDISNYKTIDKALERMCEKEKIRRIGKGLFDVPSFNKRFREYAAPSLWEIAQAIGRKYRWTIVPSGVSALNYFGLSEQVPAQYICLSDGPYRSFAFSSGKINFKHAANRNLSHLSFKTRLVIQALKAAGKEEAGNRFLARLSASLSKEDKKILLAESQTVSSWVYEKIRLIGKESPQS